MTIRAAWGTALTARGWQTEAPPRMLHNNVDHDYEGPAGRESPQFRGVT